MWNYLPGLIMSEGNEIIYTSCTGILVRKVELNFPAYANKPFEVKIIFCEC